MPGVGVIERSELQEQLTRILDPAYELFCCEVSCGIPATQAAVNAGFHAGYGDNLLAKDSIRQRVTELLADRESSGGGVATRNWIESQMAFIVRQALFSPVALDPGTGEKIRDARPADLALALNALNSLAKFKGYIVDKSSRLTSKLDLGKLPSHQVQAAIAQQMESLSPGQRDRLKALQSGSEPLTIDALDE